MLFSILNNAIYLHFHVCLLNQQCIVIFRFVRPRFRPLELCLIEVLCHHFQRLTVFLVHGKKEERQQHRHHAKSGKAQIPAGFEQIRKDPQLKLRVLRYAGGGGLPRTEQQPAGLIAPLLCRVVLFDPLTRRR